MTLKQYPLMTTATLALTLAVSACSDDTGEGPSTVGDLSTGGATSNGNTDGGNASQGGEASGQGETANASTSDGGVVTTSGAGMTTSGDATSTGGAGSTGTAGGTDSAGTTNGGATTGAAGTSTGAGGTTVAETDGLTFIVPPDVGTSFGECSVWTQDCPDGEKCMPWADDGGGAWNAVRCTNVDPSPAQLGDPCVAEGSAVSGIDDCDVGQMCWGVDDNLDGTCVALCSGNEADPTCGADTTCVVFNGGVIPVCLSTCNPLLDDCGVGEACYPVDGASDFGCLPTVAGGAYGESCESINACEAGLYCADPALFNGCPGTDGCCNTYCDLSAVICPTGTDCVPWYDPMNPPTGFEDLGGCVTTG